MTVAMKRIDVVRAQISALKAERTSLMAQTRSRVEVRAKVKALVDEWHSEATQENALHLRLTAGGQHPDLLDARKLGPAFVLMLGPERVFEALLAGIATVPEGVATYTRETRLSAIGAELDTLEAHEETLIVAAEGEGLSVIRRADARPEIVIGRPDPSPKGILSRFYLGAR